MPHTVNLVQNYETEIAMKAKKNKTSLLKPRGYASWQDRQLHKSTQVPNKRAKSSREGCKTWSIED